MAPGLCLKHVYFWVDASDPVSAQGWVPLLDLRVSLSLTLQTMQLPSTSCPKRKPRTSLELEACAVPPGRQGNFWSVATANTDANITGHSRLPAVTFLAQTWTACFLDYWKLSIFDKMIPFVLAGQLLFFAFILTVPFRVQPGGTPGLPGLYKQAALRQQRASQARVSLLLPHAGQGHGGAEQVHPLFGCKALHWGQLHSIGDTGKLGAGQWVTFLRAVGRAPPRRREQSAGRVLTGGSEKGPVMRRPSCAPGDGKEAVVGTQSFTRHPKASAGWGQAWGHIHWQGTT